MTVADLLRGLLLASANDAAATLAAARRRVADRAFVALMNRRARELGLTHTHYANAIGLDDAGQLLERRGPGQADPDPAPQRVLPRGDRPAARDAAHRVAPAHDPQPQPARARGARGQRRQDRPHLDARATSSSASASKDGRHGHLGRPRRAQRGGARPGLAGAHPLRPGPLSPRHAGAQGGGLRQRQARPSRRARAARGGPHRRAHRPPRRAPARSACSTSPASSTARCRRDRGWGRSRSAGAGGRSRACRS